MGAWGGPLSPERRPTRVAARQLATTASGSGRSRFARAATARAAASCVSCEVARVMRLCEFEFEIRIYLYILYE